MTNCMSVSFGSASTLRMEALDSPLDLCLQVKMIPHSSDLLGGLRQEQETNEKNVILPPGGCHEC